MCLIIFINQDFVVVYVYSYWLVIPLKGCKNNQELGQEFMSEDAHQSTYNRDKLKIVPTFKDLQTSGSVLFYPLDCNPETETPPSLMKLCI